MLLVQGYLLYWYKNTCFSSTLLSLSASTSRLDASSFSFASTRVQFSFTPDTMPFFKKKSEREREERERERDREGREGGREGGRELGSCRRKHLVTSEREREIPSIPSILVRKAVFWASLCCSNTAGYLLTRASQFFYLFNFNFNF